MDIFKNNETLLKWIRSCQTAQQLDLFNRLVAEFDASQFYDEINPYEIELVRTVLLEAIIERRIIIAGKRLPSQLPTYQLLVPNDSAIYLS